MESVHPATAVHPLPSVKLHPNNPHTISVPGTKVPTAAGEIANDAAAKAALTPEQKTINTLHTTQSVFMAPGMIEMVGMMGAGLLGGITKKFGWDRVTAAINMALKAPVEAMRDTTIAKVAHFPQKFMHAVSHEAEMVGGEKAEVWAHAAHKQSRKLKVHADHIDKHIASATSGVRASIDNWAENVSKEGAGAKVHDWLTDMAKKRHDVLLTKREAAVTSTKAALAGEESRVMGKIGKALSKINPFRGKEEAPVGEDTLKALVGKIDAHIGKMRTHKANAAGLKQLYDDLGKEIAKDTFKGEIKHRAADVAKFMHKAVGHAEGLAVYEGALKGGLKDIIHGMGHAVGRTPIFATLIGIGATAGIGATLLTAKSQSKQEKQALADLSTQLDGKTDTAFVKAMTHERDAHKGLGAMKTGLQVVGDGLDGVMWAQAHGGGMALMTATMLPGIGETLVPDDAPMSALVELEKDEKGEVKIDDIERTKDWRELVGVRPEVAAHGASFNRLAAADANEIVAKHMKLKEGLQLVNDDAAFTAFSKDVAAKQADAEKAVAQAPATPVAANKNTHAANDHTAAASPKTTVLPGATIHHQAAPMATVAANDIEHQGRIASQQRAIA